MQTLMSCIPAFQRPREKSEFRLLLSARCATYPQVSLGGCSVIAYQEEGAKAGTVPFHSLRVRAWLLKLYDGTKLGLSACR